MADDVRIIEQQVDQTVRTVPETRAGQYGIATLGFFSTKRGVLIPPWGTRLRERTLRWYYRNPYSTIVQSAVAAIAKKIASLPWEIRGPKADVDDMQARLQEAQLGAGWRDFVMKFVIDYLRQDIGTFVEVIGPGEPDGPLVGPFTSVAVLDALRCYPTGNPIFPVVYVDDEGKQHLLHTDRVERLYDMPDTDEDTKGAIGMSALSRALAIADREIQMGRYIHQRLDDLPPPGIILAKNVTREIRDMAVQLYRQEQAADLPPVWGQTLWLYGAQVEKDIELTPVSFSVPPEKFDYYQYKVQVDVQELAFAFGVDVQEFWQLTGGNIGSGTQSVVLAQKGRGKTIADLITSLERIISSLLPDEYEFGFKFRDHEEDKQIAESAEAWANVASAVRTDLSPQEVRQLLANQVEAVHDVITDELGQVVTRDDVDPKPQNASGDAVLPGDEEVDAPSDEAAVEDKEFSLTSAEFKALLGDLARAALAGELNRRRFGIVMRAHLRRLGQEAFRDGLEDGGVDRSDMDDNDRISLSLWLQDQSPFVSAFSKALYDDKVSLAQIGMRTEMWSNKSLRAAYTLGLASAASSKPFRWMLGQTESHCADCLRLNGQVHRMRDWRARGLYPGSSLLECGGFHCNCRLVLAEGERARGRF